MTFVTAVILMVILLVFIQNPHLLPTSFSLYTNLRKHMHFADCENRFHSWCLKTSRNLWKSFAQTMLSMGANTLTPEAPMAGFLKTGRGDMQRKINDSLVHGDTSPVESMRGQPPGPVKHVWNRSQLWHPTSVAACRPSALKRDIIHIIRLLLGNSQRF